MIFFRGLIGNNIHIHTSIQEVGWQLDRRLKGWNEPGNSTNIYQEVSWYEQIGAIISRMRRALAIKFQGLHCG
jgi:hypothetical protein